MTILDYEKVCPNRTIFYMFEDGRTYQITDDNLKEIIKMGDLDIERISAKIDYSSTINEDKLICKPYIKIYLKRKDKNE